MEGREDIRKIVSRKTNFAAGRRRAHGRRQPFLRWARARLARLAARPELVELARIAADRGARVWIVGGALRDVLLGRPAAEVDVAVSGGADEIAREMEARKMGRAILLSADRRPRVFRVARAGRIVDVAELEGGSIGTDLARRDYTVNAIAAELPASRLLDPMGGIADLCSHRLRMVSKQNLLDDPLRGLRGARLLATHDLLPDRATSTAVRTAAPALARVAAERVQAELAKLLEAPRAAPALSWAAAAGLLGPAFRWAIPDRKWGRIARAAAALDSERTRGLPPNRLRRLRLAFLAGRARLTPGQAAVVLRRGRWGTAEAEEVSRLLDVANTAKKAGKETVWRWLLDAGDRARDALTLLEVLDPRTRAVVRRLRAVVLRRRTIPEIRGADLLEWLGVAPGPQVGRLLDEVRIEALAGRIRTRADARRWLLKRIPGSRVRSLE